MLVGQGSTTQTLAAEQVQQTLANAFDTLNLDQRRVLVIIPDGTRTAPIALLFHQLYEQLGPRVARLDYLIALGTHQVMPEAAVQRLIGVSQEELAERYPKVHIYNHHWDDPGALHTYGVISRHEAEQLTGGLLVEEVPVVMNRLLLDYDQVIICGPVFPHEVAGFSGGAKYLVPGISGPDIINFTHWLGALKTSMHTIGVKDTPIRRVIHRAADFVPCPLLAITLVSRGEAFHGIYVGPHQEAFNAAADLSLALNSIEVARPFKRVLAMPRPIYDDLWTAAKAMYKTEPAVADGGEVIIYAPHLTEVSYTHGEVLEAVGYHVRDYFLKQWERFKAVPGMILAHSTHVKGVGTFENGIESPRIKVTLATGISEERCRRIDLGYQDPRSIDPREWEGREDEGILFVPHAGEQLYRARAIAMRGTL